MDRFLSLYRSSCVLYYYTYSVSRTPSLSLFLFFDGESDGRSDTKA